jgi:16S rRNA (cytosine967-C5)-methyltransferase
LDEIKHITSVQRSILERASGLVKPGGVMVYSTCTTEPEENWELVDGFLNDHSEWIRDDARQWVDGSVVNPMGEVETIPHVHDMDGSYAVRLVRR